MRFALNNHQKECFPQDEHSGHFTLIRSDVLILFVFRQKKKTQQDDVREMMKKEKSRDLCSETD
jgi:hypothetical protein